MTIEIKQLIIRAVADARTDSAQRPAEPSLPPAALNGTAARPPVLSRDDRAGLVASCVREVLRQLERSRQR
jgi:hypothetical protein